MDTTALKNFLSSFFATLLKALGGAAVAHRLVSPDAASGLMSYADPLAALVLIGAGQMIAWTHSAAAKTEIQFLKEKVNHITALADAKLDHDFSAYCAQHPQGEPFVDRRAPAPVVQVLTQPTNPKI